MKISNYGHKTAAAEAICKQSYSVMFGNRSVEIEKLFELPVIAYTAKPILVCDLLFPEERNYIAKAVAKRRAEFGTARLLARSALIEGGSSIQSLAPNPDRSPRWPRGVVGSISHSSQLCCAVVAASKHNVSIGVDIESIEAVNSEIDNIIMTPSELALKEERPIDSRDILTAIVFTAKEAIYKCQYPLTGCMLDFTDIELEVDLEAERYSVKSVKIATYDIILQVTGSYRIVGEHIMSSAEFSP